MSRATARRCPNGELITTSHDGYLARFGVIHRRVLMAAQDGTRLDGEDTLTPAPGGKIRGNETDFALRFHLHPSVKASRLSDARGVMLVLPNRDVWTFEALDDKVDLEDSVFLAGNDGPRRTAQIVIRQDSRHASSIRWSFCPLLDVGVADHRAAQCAPRAGTSAVSTVCRHSTPSPLRSPVKAANQRASRATGDFGWSTIGKRERNRRAPGQKKLLTKDLAHDRYHPPRFPCPDVRFRQDRADRIRQGAGRPRRRADLDRRHRQGASPTPGSR